MTVSGPRPWWLVCARALALALPAPGAADPARVEALLRQADESRSADPEGFRALLGQLDGMLDQATPLQREQLRFLHTYRLALEGRFDQAIAELQRLLAETRDVTLRFRAGAFLANNHAVTREFSAALGALDQALGLLPGVTDREARHQGLLAAAIVYNQVGQYPLGLHYAELTLSEPASGRSRCIAWITRLEARFNLRTLDGDEARLHQEIASCLDHGEVLLANFMRGYLARSWAARGDHQRAIELLAAHQAEVVATGYPGLINEMASLLAEYHLAVDNLGLAARHANQALAVGTGDTRTLPRVTAHRILYEVALRRGDTAAALDHFRRYAEADKAYLDDVKARELAFQMAQHDSLQKTQTIELLNRRNEVLQLEQEVARQSAANSRLLLGLLALLLASIGFWAYKIKRLQISFRRLAETDVLTGISNRLHFTRQVEQDLAGCARNGEALGLVMFDLDNFKAINDRHGHAAGDWVLRQVAEACRGACRSKDRIGRIGGEEFAIALVGCDLDAATKMARDCRERIAAIDTSPTGSRFPVSASFGVSGTVLSGYRLETLLAQADLALYRSKGEGRNRVSVFQATAAVAATLPLPGRPTVAGPPDPRPV
jgi:diguanylate cyclase (GGDEF)-like protein